jgi:hypothetical protein
MATEILASNRGRINVPNGPFLDARGEINPAWRIWLLNPNVQSLQAAAPLEPYSGGLGVSTAPSIGQLPVATSTGVYIPSAFTSLPLFTSTTPGLAPASGGGTTKFLRADSAFAVPPTFTSTTPGYAPASGGGTTNFLRADAVYASPVAGSATQVQYNSSGTFAASSLFTYDAGTNTVGFGNITGTALSLDVTPKTPTITENAGTIGFQSQSAVKPNSNGGNISFFTGNGNGTGVPGTISFGIPGGVGITLSPAQLSFNGAEGAIFLSSNGGLFFQGGTFATAPDIQFLAGVDLAGTGNRPIQFGTDSGFQIEVKEDPFGDPITVLGLSSGKVGMFGSAGVVQAAAYTKTYSTASRTIPNATFTNLATTAATNVAPYGFTTQAQADAIATQVNALAADVLILKQLIVSLVNDSSTTLGVGLNAT